MQQLLHFEEKKYVEKYFAKTGEKETTQREESSLKSTTFLKQSWKDGKVTIYNNLYVRHFYMLENVYKYGHEHKMQFFFFNAINDLIIIIK